MKRFLLVALAFLALIATVCCDDVNCFYGILEESEDEPDADWDRECDLTNTENCIVTCVGDRPACFKIRMEGDDDFFSIYGCTRQSDFPSDANSLIPDGEGGDPDAYNADTIGLGKLPDPHLDPEDNGGEEVPDCIYDDDYVGDMPNDDDLGGGDIKGAFCACDSDECNGAPGAMGGAAGAATVALMLTLTTLM